LSPGKKPKPTIDPDNKLTYNKLTAHKTYLHSGAWATPTTHKDNTMATLPHTNTKIADAIKLLGDRDAHLSPERLRYLAKFTNDTDVYSSVHEDWGIDEDDYEDGEAPEDPGDPKMTYAGMEIDYKEFCHQRAIKMLVEDPTLLDPIDPENRDDNKDVKLRKLQDKINWHASMVFENVYNREPIEKLVENQNWWDRFDDRNYELDFDEKLDKYGNSLERDLYDNKKLDEDYCAREAIRIVPLRSDAEECWTPYHYLPNSTALDTLLEWQREEDWLDGVDWEEVDKETMAKIDPEDKLNKVYNGDKETWVAEECLDLEEKLAYHWEEGEYEKLDYKLQELIMQESERAIEQYWRNHYPECNFTRTDNWLVIEYLTDNTRLPYAGPDHYWNQFSYEIMLDAGMTTLDDPIAHFGAKVSRGYEKKLDKIAN
jgi:hypothetical protein